MSTFKRVFMIVYLICSLAVLVLFALALLLPDGAAMMAFLHACVPLAVLLVLVMLVMLIGLIAYTGVALVVSITRATARLRASESGSISIEKSALVSIASRALEQVDGMALQSLTVDVLQRGDTAIIDARVVATPLGTDSLMALAGRIQEVTKRALEAFTEHEVRYVAVNFVEPRRRSEQAEMGAAVDAYTSEYVAAAPAQDAYAAPAAARAQAASQAAPAAQTTYVAAPAEEAAPVSGDAGYPSDSPDAPAPDQVAPREKKPSLWKRAKAKAAGLRTRMDEEDAVETQAEVVVEAEPAAQQVAEAPAEAPAGEPAAAEPSAPAADAEPAPQDPAPTSVQGEPDGASAAADAADEDEAERAAQRRP